MQQQSVLMSRPAAAIPSAGSRPGGCSGGGGVDASAAAAAIMDVSAGLVSRVHCTADGHITIAADHGVMLPPVPADAPPEALPPPACPPAVCLDVGRRYLAAVMAGVSGGLSPAVESELLSLLHPDVEARVGVTSGGGGGGGVGRFLERLRADNSAYDNWHMTLLAAASPPCGGEVFLWVDETARNVGPLPGMEAPTNRTSRSLTVHRLFLDSAGRITQAWARYQLFEEMRQLMLRDDASPGEREGEGEGEEAQAKGEGEAMEVETPQAAALPPGQGEQGPSQTAAGSPAGAAVGGAPGGEAGRRASASAAAAAPAAAPDLTALPFVQRLMGSVAPVAAAMASHGLQGEGAAAQSQAAYAVFTGGSPSALPPAGPMGHSSLTPPSEMTAAALDATSGGTAPKAAAAAADPSAASSMLTAAAAADAALPPPVIPDFEAQAGRSVATWLGLVDSSYSGVRDVFGSMSEGLALWDALGLWPHLRGARGRDAVLGELQRLHAEYDIRIRRGSWAVDRAGRVAFCGWEAQAVPLSAAAPAGPEQAERGGGAYPAAAGSPRTAASGADAPGSPSKGVVGPNEAHGAVATPAGSEGIMPYIFTSLDVYGLSPQGHVTDVVMYRTALPGEAERVFKGHLLHPPSPPAQAAGPGGT